MPFPTSKWGAAVWGSIPWNGNDEELAQELTISVGDTLDSYWQDGGPWYSPFYTTISVSLSDSNDNWTDTFFSGSGVIGILISDDQSGNWSDAVSYFLSNSPSASDTINNYLDAIQLNLYDPYTFNDAYTINDSVVVELIYTYSEFISDGINIQDSVITDLIVNISFSFSDSYSLSDAFLLDESITIRFGDIIPPYYDYFSYTFFNGYGILLVDNYVISDSSVPNLLMDFAYNDSYTINDGVSIADSGLNDMLGDSYSMQDGITISLSSPLDVTVNDNVDNFLDNLVTSNTAGINSYIRRYLNDVITVE